MKMRNPWHEVWGAGRGPATRLAPEVRILSGTAALCACMVAPAPSRSGSLLVIAVTVGWLVACRPPKRMLGWLFLLGLFLFLPWLLLAAFGGAYGMPTLASAWILLLRAMSALLVSVATMTSLSITDLASGLSRLPIPTMVSSILVQIVQQTATLWDETRNVAAAMAVRGAAGAGLTTWRVVASLPRAWLPRVMLRAERVSGAMEVRGYVGSVFVRSERSRVQLADTIALASAFGLLALAIALRWWSPL